MAKSKLDDLPTVTPADRAAWRAWLEANHATAAGVWLVFYKKGSGQPTITYDEMLDEALCFGWIDSKAVSLDERRYKQLITPRKPKGVWSGINKAKVEKLVAEGRMTEAGLAAIERAKANGAWTALDAVEALTIPEDLAAALAADADAARHFAAFNPSSKKNILFWIASAKRPETRQKRIAETVALAAKNVKSRQ